MTAMTDPTGLYSLFEARPGRPGWNPWILLSRWSRFPDAVSHARSVQDDRFLRGDSPRVMRVMDPEGILKQEFVPAAALRPRGASCIHCGGHVTRPLGSGRLCDDCGHDQLPGDPEAP